MYRLFVGLHYPIKTYCGEYILNGYYKTVCLFFDFNAIK